MTVKLSGSFRRYVVSGRRRNVQPWLEENLVELLQKNRFRSIDSSAGQVQSVGWTTVEGCVPADFAELEFWYGPILMLGVRLDVKRVHAGALRVRRMEAEAVERREVGAKIPPARRREILETLQTELLRRSVPTCAVYRMLWDVAAGRLLFSATSDAVNTAFRSLFRDTFDLVAEGVTPASWPAQLGYGPEDSLRYEALQPAAYVA
jgi:hypothetical protein